MLYRQLPVLYSSCVVQFISVLYTVMSVLYSYRCAVQTVISVLYRQLSLCSTVIPVLYRQLSLCCTDSYLCVVQTVAMLNEEELRKEVTMLERTLRVKLCMQKLMSRPRLSESMGEFLLLFFFFHWE